MRTRLARAYGLSYAVLGSAVAVLAGMLVQQRTLGVTRQPLPLVWPIAVLHITLTQLLLPDLLGPTERVALRGHISRAVRAAVSVTLVAIGAATYVTAREDRPLLVFFLLMTTVGFIAAALARTDPWVWTLGVGLTVIGLAFVVPVGGASVSRVLESVPLPLAAASIVLAAEGYALQGLLTGGRRSPLTRPPD
jgi:hypothetical protein